MAGLDNHEHQDPSASAVNNEISGSNLGNSVQAGDIHGDVHSTIENSTIAGGNVDQSRRIKIGLGGFAAVLVLATTGTIGYKIGTSDTTQTTTTANNGLAASLTLSPRTAIDGVPGAGIPLAGFANAGIATSAFFATVAYDEHDRIYFAVTKSGEEQLSRDFGGDSCSVTIHGSDLLQETRQVRHVRRALSSSASRRQDGPRPTVTRRPRRPERRGPARFNVGDK